MFVGPEDPIFGGPAHPEIPYRLPPGLITFFHIFFDLLFLGAVPPGARFDPITPIGGIRPIGGPWRPSRSGVRPIPPFR